MTASPMRIALIITEPSDPAKPYKGTVPFSSVTVAHRRDETSRRNEVPFSHRPRRCVGFGAGTERPARGPRGPRAHGRLRRDVRAHGGGREEARPAHADASRRVV